MPSVNLRHQCKRGLEFLRNVFKSPERRPDSGTRRADLFRGQRKLVMAEAVVPVS